MSVPVQALSVVLVQKCVTQLVAAAGCRSVAACRFLLGSNCGPQPQQLLTVTLRALPQVCQLPDPGAVRQLATSAAHAGRRKNGAHAAAAALLRMRRPGEVLLHCRPVHKLLQPAHHGPGPWRPCPSPQVALTRVLHRSRDDDLSPYVPTYRVPPRHPGARADALPAVLEGRWLLATCWRCHVGAPPALHGRFCVADSDGCAVHAANCRPTPSPCLLPMRECCRLRWSSRLAPNRKLLVSGGAWSCAFCARLALCRVIAGVNVCGLPSPSQGCSSP